MPSFKRMHPKVTGGKILSVKIGPVWTLITLRLSTKRFQKRVGQVKARKRAKR